MLRDSGSAIPWVRKYWVRSAIRWRTSSRKSVTDWPMMLEWNCSRLVMHGRERRVPTAPPRLRSMLNRPEADAGLARTRCRRVATTVSGVMHQRLADGAHDIGQEELVAGVVQRHVDVHEAACGERC